MLNDFYFDMFWRVVVSDCPVIHTFTNMESIFHEKVRIAF